SSVITRLTVSAAGRRRYTAVPLVALTVLWQAVHRQRCSLREWMPMLPWPRWPLAGHAKLGQNVVVGSILVLRVALGNLPRGVCLDPRLHYKCTSPRFSGELPQRPAADCLQPCIFIGDVGASPSPVPWS